MKLGLGESYDNVSVLPVKLRAYLDLTKPASSLGVGGAFFLASIFYFYYTGQPELIGERFSSIIFACVTVVFAHGGSQAMNMAEDAVMDRETPHKQDRPIPAGIVTEEEARTLAWLALSAAIGRAYLVNNGFGVLVTFLVLLGVFYNLNPIRAKERIISIPWQAASRGLFMFPAVWAAYGDMWTLTPWVLSLFMFFYVLGFQNTADIIDEDVDRKYGISTLVVELGLENVVYIAGGCMLMMLSTIWLAVELAILPTRMIWMLAILPFCMVMLYHMMYNPYEIDDRTGNHPAWMWFYLGMVLSVAIPLAVEVLSS